MATIRMMWDCVQCGCTGISGPDLLCPSCGHPRPQGVKFYLPAHPETAPVVTDPAELQRAHAGPDIICGYCGASNSALNSKCHQCGAPLDGSHRQPTHRYGHQQFPTSGDNTPGEAPIVTHRESASDYTATYQPRESSLTGNFSSASVGSWLSSHQHRLISVGAIGAVIAIMAFIAFMLLRVQTDNVRVSAFSWQRTIFSEEYRTIREEDWSVPAGGRQVSSYTTIRTYVPVLDHYQPSSRQVAHQVEHTDYRTCYEDSGNGYAESYDCSTTSYTTEYTTEYYDEPVYRHDPVYDTKYVYDIDKWVATPIQTTSGQDQKPYWPSAYESNHPVREIGRSDKYLVIFKNRDGHEYPARTASLAEWQSYDQESYYAIEVNGFGTITKIVGLAG